LIILRQWLYSSSLERINFNELRWCATEGYKRRSPPVAPCSAPIARHPYPIANKTWCATKPLAHTPRTTSAAFLACPYHRWIGNHRRQSIPYGAHRGQWPGPRSEVQIPATLRRCFRWGKSCPTPARSLLVRLANSQGPQTCWGETGRATLWLRQPRSYDLVPACLLWSASKRERSFSSRASIEGWRAKLHGPWRSMVALPTPPKRLVTMRF
jgi:hypothetical protein